MSKSKKYKDRIEDLFSDGEHLHSEPLNGKRAINSDISPHEDIPTIPSTSIPDLLPGKESHVRETSNLGWGEYLNAIDRDEHLGFSFNQETIQLISSNGQNGNSSQGILEAPLQIGDNILGTLQLEGDAEWSEAEEQLLTTIAQQVTQHVENLKLLEQAEQYRAEAEQATRQLTHEGWEAYLQSPSAPAQGFTYDQNRILTMDPRDPKAFTDFASAMTVQTQNLKVRDEEIGQLVVADPNSDKETVNSLMTIIAERLSVHIENLRLLDETEHSRQQLDKRAAELETVAQVGTAAATILEPQALLQSVVDLTSYSFKLYHTSVYLLNETGDFLELAAASGKIGHAIMGEGYKIRIYQEKSIIAKAARRRETIIVGDTHDDPDFLYHHLLPDALSEMSIPLIVGEQLIGVFDVQADSAGRFTEENTRTFTTLASQTADRAAERPTVC